MSPRVVLAIVVGLLVVAATIFVFWPRPAPKPPLVVGELPPFCRDLSFEGVVHAVCELDPKGYAVFVARADADGNVDLGPLGLGATLLPAGATTHLALLSSDWENQSHYLLLLALPLMLLLFRRRQT